MKRPIYIILTLLLTLYACTTKSEYQQYDKTNIDCGFNTFCSLTAYTKSEEEFNNYYNVMIEDFTYYHKLFDIYNTYENLNNLKTINDNAGIKEIEVDEAIIELLKFSSSLTYLTNNSFDIANGSLLSVWHKYRDNGKIANENNEYGLVPSKEELIEANINNGFDYIEINEENNTIFINNPNVSLDVGAIAKGYAVEKISEHLIELGLEYGAVNGGGNQKIIGSKIDNTGYKVGIQNPRPSSTGNDGVIVVIKDIKDKSVVTSGDYQNYYLGENNIILSHIINYQTLMPADYYQSVTIITKDSALADALSTSLFTLNYETGLQLINTISAKYDEEIAVVWISANKLADTSIRANTLSELYITATSNIKDQLITK